MTETNETGLVVGEQVLPTARSIKAILIDQLRSAVVTERRKRGEVLVPEDTFEVQRGLARVSDTAGEYQRAFAEVIKEARALAEEELIDAVGEEAGIPRQGITVTDPEGDIRISLDTQNEYEIDMDALRSAVVFAILSDPSWRDELADTIDRDTFLVSEKTETYLAGLIVDALTMLGTLGRFTPQVSKVRTFAAELARTPGGVGVSAAVSGSIRKTTRFRGVKIERKEVK